MLSVSLLTGLLTVAPAAGPKETVFDLKAILAPPLNSRVLKTTDKGGIITEEVKFHSENDGGKAVEIFAFFSYPKGARKLPAFVWNQGGLARASAYWTELGAKRGYAALCIDFPIPGYRSTGGYPINSGLELPADPRRAPIFHGAVALLRAVSFLESRSEVDPARIGMAGSSWGGFFTTLMAGLDPRLKAASSMFGCGEVQLGNLWWDMQGLDPKRDAAFRERWRTTLDPAYRLPASKTPIAWFTGTNDQFYWLPSVVRSHERAGGPKHLSLLPNWKHALTPRLDEQVFAWLDVHLKDAPKFLEVSPVEVVKEAGPAAAWKFQGPRKAVAAELHLSYGDAGNWHSRWWKTARAEIRGDTCTAILPGGKLPYYVAATVIDADGFRYSTPTRRVDPADFGGKVNEAPDYDGCAEWGGFEAGQLDFLRLHGHAVPPLAQDAKEGKAAARLPAGATTLPPILFTTGVKHRFACFAKAEKPAQVTVELAGSFDGKRHAEKKQFSVGKGWTQLALDFLPPAAHSADLRATVVVPAGGSLTLDAVSFRPVRTP